MTENVARIDDDVAKIEADSHRYIGNGIAWSGLLYIALGLFMIVVGNIWDTLPLNTPGVFQLLGYYAQGAYIKYMSIAFFGIGGLVIASGLLYKNRTGSKPVIKLSRITAIVQQPWIAIALLVIGGIWLYIINDSSGAGHFASTFAKLAGYDLSNQGQRDQYIWMMEQYPIMPFLMFGVLSLCIYPMTMYTSAVLLQDTGLTMNKKKSMPQEQRFRMYTVKGLFVGGIFCCIIGVAVWGIGYVRAIGLDLTYFLLPMYTYDLWMNLYYIFPIVFGVACMITSFVYYFAPRSTVARVLAWYCGLVLLLVPFCWFFTITLVMNLWHTGKEIEPKKSRRSFFYGFAIAIFSILIPLFIFWMLGLNLLNPGAFSFTINWSNLTQQAGGLVWTFTLILVLFYVVAALYMIIEARSSTVAAQKSFMRGLAFLFTFLALMELVVVLYSVLYHPPYGFALIPNTIDSTAGSGNGVRGDLGLAIEFAGISVIYITFCIEKYIKNSKSYILTKIILILAIAGSLAFFFSYVPDISNAKWYKTGGYAFLAFPVIGMVFGMLLILVTYGQLAKQTSGDIRKNSITIMVGFLITIAAVILHTLRGNLPLFPFNWLVFIVLNIVGIVILMQGILKSSY